MKRSALKLIIKEEFRRSLNLGNALDLPNKEKLTEEIRQILIEAGMLSRGKSWLKGKADKGAKWALGKAGKAVDRGVKAVGAGAKKATDKMGQKNVDRLKTGLTKGASAALSVGAGAAKGVGAAMDVAKGAVGAAGKVAKKGIDKNQARRMKNAPEMIKKLSLSYSSGVSDLEKLFVSKFKALDPTNFKGDDMKSIAASVIANKETPELEDMGNQLAQLGNVLYMVTNAQQMQEKLLSKVKEKMKSDPTYAAAMKAANSPATNDKQQEKK